MSSSNKLPTEVVDSITNHLSSLLADIHQLYVKTSAFHWNVVDPRFKSLHELFEEGYTQLSGDLDSVAERIRALGKFAPGSVEKLASLSRLDDTPDTTNGNEMIDYLIHDFGKLNEFIREGISTAEQAADPGTADLLTSLLRNYEKYRWMLQSHKG